VGAPADLDSDEVLVSRAVGELARRTRFPVVFAGLERSGSVPVTAIAGARTKNIEGLVVRSARGLGGAALVEQRPRLALDYRTNRSITHDYDRAILGEGIATLFAVPVVVSGRGRGIIYCGSWNQSPVGDLASQPAFAAASALATELRIRDEVQRRFAQLPRPDADRAFDAAAREDLRESFAELRSIAAAVDDAGIRDRLAQVERKLAALSRDDRSPDRGAHDAAHDVVLSPREIDVLACCALGSTNSEIATTLGLKEATVKSYLAAAMTKLDASTRHAAVAKARRAGILP
jgi:LuxR family transcriptional regulator, regulator of acetate metabolism